ncbi:MAG: GNAT family N-acetyltransferase [Veillonellaceae bacterium]|nr:GNAT family N-acetyltransferase [Veillonellaceae bacterium]
MTKSLIAKYTDDRRNSLVEMILEIQRHEFQIPITREDQPDLAAISRFYQQGNGNFWVALSDGQVVGSIGLLDIGHQQVALRKMFVRADFRGGEHGIARALLATAMAWTTARGVTDIFLGTTDKFLAAHRFYEKNGFVRIEKTDLPATFPVMQVDTVFYHRRTTDLPGKN